MASNIYLGYIFTNHALDRMRDRGMPKDLAVETMKSPDRSFDGKNPGSIEYHKRFGERNVSVIAKQNEKKEWIVISCWVDPPFPGSTDIQKQEAYRHYQKASFWKKFFLTLKKQIGL